MSDRLRQRSDELGLIGHRLSQFVREADVIVAGWPSVDQLYYIGKIALKEPLRAAAISMLLCNFPCQVSLSKAQLMSLIDLSQWRDEQLHMYSQKIQKPEKTNKEPLHSGQKQSTTSLAALDVSDRRNIKNEEKINKNQKTSKTDGSDDGSEPSPEKVAIGSPSDDNVALPRGENPTPIRKEAGCKPLYDKVAQRDNFPLKSHQGAMNKVNVYASSLFDAIREKSRSDYNYLCDNVGLLDGLYNDSASAVILYWQSTRHVIDDPLTLGAWAVKNQKDAKGITTVIKALGLNSTAHGAMVCELNSLAGRDVGELKWHDEIDYRCGRAPDNKSVPMDEVALRAAVRQILVHELDPAEIEFDELDEHWSKRWSWCVNGAHSRTLERIEPQWKVGFLGRMHRRVFSENTDTDPVKRWSGKSYFSPSQKLELGKTRAIFGSDSVSYFAFEHLLSQVEKHWRNRKVILDPGAGGTCGMVKRIRKLREEAVWSLMLDYDDFNSQHTLESMAIVIDELCKFVGYDEALSAKLVDSFQNSYIVTSDGLLKLRSTLMSGHRATTLINSVLNLAYIMVCEPGFFKNPSLHVGDDVYIGLKSDREAVSVLESVQKAGIRMNPLKQSFGMQTAEFLRCAMGRFEARGYVARAIGAIISGNWVSENRLDPVEAITTMIGAAWTLANRSEVDVSYLLIPDLCRVTGLKKKLLIDVLAGRASINGSPLRASNNFSESYSMAMRGTEVVQAGVVLEHRGRTAATDSYLTSHVTEPERVALSLAGGDIKEMMVWSSYSKTLISSDVTPAGDVDLKFHGLVARPFEAIDVADCLRLSRKRGLLEGYPLIMMVKDRLSASDVRRLLALLGVDSGIDPFMTAFGQKEKNNVFVNGYITYQDARTLGPVANGRIMSASYPIKM